MRNRLIFNAFIFWLIDTTDKWTPIINIVKQCPGRIVHAITFTIQAIQIFIQFEKIGIHIFKISVPIWIYHIFFNLLNSILFKIFLWMKYPNQATKRLHFRHIANLRSSLPDHNWSFLKSWKMDNVDFTSMPRTVWI